MKTTKKKNGKRPKKKWKTNQSTKINLIGCDTIVNSSSLLCFHLSYQTVITQAFSIFQNVQVDKKETGKKGKKEKKKERKDDGEEKIICPPVSTLLNVSFIFPTI